MGYKPKVEEAELNRFSRLALRLNQAHPSHVWTPNPPKGDGSGRPGCKKCPAGSPFQVDRSSHLYIIEEEP